MIPEFDIAICGAGPVGQVLALQLLKRGVNPARIVIIDAKTSAQAAKDSRTIALSYGSRQILQVIDCWPIKSTEIQQIHVSRRGQFGRTLIDCQDHNVPALGYVARYADILHPLSEQLSNHSQTLTSLRPAKVSTLSMVDNQVEIHLDDGRQITAAIAVQAEGGLFGEQRPQTRHRDYQQTALITHAITDAPQVGRAYERFTDQGPLALLPQENGYALVWCSEPTTATQLLALNDTAFLTELHQAFGDRLGRFTSCSARFAFPLGLNAETSAPTGRCISIGNAAQTLHPVAGQGMNLGLRDAQQLALFLSRSLTPESLQKYFQARRLDRIATIGLTDTMAKLFTSSSESSIAQTLFSAGLSWIDVFPPAQSLLAKQMMFGYR